MERKVYSPASKPQEDFINATEDIVIYGGSMGCVPPSTEFLTDKGWVRFDSYEKGMNVAQYCPHSDRITFTDKVEYVKLPSTGFSRLSGRGMQMTLSDEHRVLYWNQIGGRPREIPFSEVKSRHERSKTKGWTGKIKTTFKVSGTKGLDLTEGELRLQVAVMADGRVVKGGKDNYTQMRFAKKRKYDRLKSILDTYGLPYKDFGEKESDRYTSGKSYEIVVFPKYPDKRYSEKYWNATQEQLEIIFDEVGHWDGTIRDNGAVVFYSKHKCDADFIQYVFASQGRNTSLVEDKRDKKGHWIVNANAEGSGGFRSFANKDRKNPLEEVPCEDGFKYCFTTETGYLPIREEGKIVLTGNSGKSFASLLLHSRFMGIPEYRGAVIRKNSTMFNQVGSIWDEGKRFFRDIDPNCRIRSSPSMEIESSAGAILSFGHFGDMSAAEKWQGAQLWMAVFDEMTQFEEEQLWMIISRLRTPYKEFKTGVRGTCNPDKFSWLLKYVEWYLYPKGHPLAGRADPKKAGKVRWIVRESGIIHWFDSKEEALEKFPKSKPRSFRFIPATVYDNIYMSENYIANLESLPEVEKERNLYGNWYAEPKLGGVVSKKDFRIVEEEPKWHEIEATVRAYDLAGTLKAEDGSNGDPDYFASIKMSKLKDGNYFIHEVQRTRIEFGSWVPFILSNAELDGKWVDIILPVDPNASGKFAADMMLREIAGAGYAVRQFRPQGDKLTRFRPFASVAHNGGIVILDNCGQDYENGHKDTLDFFWDEVERFDGQRRGGTMHDDRHTCRQ